MVEIGAGLFPLIQLSHMLTLILCALSKAAGAFAITSPLLRLHVAWGLKEIEMRLWNHKGNVTGERIGPRDPWTDQGASERNFSQKCSTRKCPRQTTSGNLLSCDF